MKLPGRLRSTTLGDVLGSLHRDRATGVLELIEVEGPAAGRRHRVRFEDGLVADVETALGGPRLGEILRREGFVGDDALKQLARELLRAPSKKAGAVLIEKAEVKPFVVTAALRRQLRLRLDALFTLADAFVRFHVAHPKGEREPMLPLSPREFLHGRSRIRDRAGAEEPRSRRRPATPGRDRARAEALRVLGLDGEADKLAVQRAFRSLARQVHPDRHPRADAAEVKRLLQRFAEISAAYHLLVA